MKGTLYTVHGLPEGNGGKSAAAGARPWTEDSKALLDKAARELFGVRPVGVDVDTRGGGTEPGPGALAVGGGGGGGGGGEGGGGRGRRGGGAGGGRGGGGAGAKDLGTSPPPAYPRQP